MTEENNNSEDENDDGSIDMGIDEKMAQYSDKECEYDDHVQGALNHGNTEQHPVVEALLADVNDHGECHVTVEDHDKRLEVRQGNSYFNFERGVIQIDTTKGYSHLMVPMDRVVSWEKPMEPWE